MSFRRADVIRVRLGRVGRRLNDGSQPRDNAPSRTVCLRAQVGVARFADSARQALDPSSGPNDRKARVEAHPSAEARRRNFTSKPDAAFWSIRLARRRFRGAQQGPAGPKRCASEAIRSGLPPLARSGRADHRRQVRHGFNRADRLLPRPGFAGPSVAMTPSHPRRPTLRGARRWTRPGCERRSSAITATAAAISTSKALARGTSASPTRLTSCRNAPPISPQRRC